MVKKFGISVSTYAFEKAELMHYSKLETVMTYVSTKKAREKIPAFLETHYAPLIAAVRGLQPGQNDLNSYM